VAGSTAVAGVASVEGATAGVEPDSRSTLRFFVDPLDAGADECAASAATTALVADDRDRFLDDDVEDDPPTAAADDEENDEEGLAGVCSLVDSAAAVRLTGLEAGYGDLITGEPLPRSPVEL